ncbi:MAG: hypothetical protein ACXWO7_10620, partial [Candidatus Limnocylindrales bacterium]
MPDPEQQQLELPFEAGATGPRPPDRARGSSKPLPRRFRTMTPLLAEGPFDDPGYRFEPWWPGLRVVLVAESGAVRLEAEQLADPLAAFPELARVAEFLRSDGVALDGTLLVLDAHGRPDADLLRERLSFPEVRDGAPALVASDLLYAAGEEVTGRPFGERLERLTALLRETDWCMVARGYVGEGRTVAAALEAMGLQAMSARHLASRYRAGPSAGAWLRV